MSAINVVLQPEAAHMLTDGAFYSPDGRLLTVESKVHTVLHLNLALSGRGYSFFAWRLAGGMSEHFTTFDAAIDGLAGAFSEALGYLDPRGRELMNSAQYQLVVVGMSERTGRSAGYAFLNKPEGGMPAREPIPFEDAMASPCSPEFFDRLIELGLDPTEPGFDPERDGLRLMREQRATAWPNPLGGNQAQAVGGFCQHTVVRRGDVSTRILERWPDQIGRKIAA